MKHKVVLSRRFNQAAIEVVVTDEKLQVSMQLADFLKALATESSKRLAADASLHAGNPSILVTNAALRKRLEESISDSDVCSTLVSVADGLLSEMKKSSVVAQ
jgi:hypothetical protein